MEFPSAENPCLTCGACCAHFRVSFYWAEADPKRGGAVPIELTEELPPYRRCMAGTNARPPRCVALQGRIGENASCAVYERRLSPCREFGANWENGIGRFLPGELERCNRARAAYGLPALGRHSNLEPPTTA